MKTTPKREVYGRYTGDTREILGSKPKLRTTPKTPMIDEGARAASDLSRHSGSSAAAHLVRARVRVRVSVKVRVRVGVRGWG